MRNGQLGINLSESLLRCPGIVALNRQNYAQDIQIGYGARATFGVVTYEPSSPQCSAASVNSD